VPELSGQLKRLKRRGQYYGRSPDQGECLFKNKRGEYGGKCKNPTGKKAKDDTIYKETVSATGQNWLS